MTAISRGTIVLFSPPQVARGRRGEVLPRPDIAAVVTNVVDPTTGVVNLRLFLDGPDGARYGGYRFGRTEDKWIQSVSYDATGQKPRAWRFTTDVVAPPPTPTPVPPPAPSPADPSTK